MIELLTDLSWLVFRSTIFLTLGACVAALGTALIRTRSQPTTAIVWSMALVAGLLVVPARFDVPWYAEASIPPSQAAMVASGQPATGATTTAPASVQRPVHPNRTAPQGANGPSRATKATIGQSASAGHADPSGLAMLWELLPMVWLVGLLIIAAVALTSYAGLLLMLRNAWRPHRSWQQEHDEAAESLGIGAPPNFWVHAYLGPFVCLTPRGHCLVIPSDQWSKLRHRQRDVILKHELAHYIRRDVWRTIPARMIVLLHWFNPFAWLAAQRVEESAEWARTRSPLRDNPPSDR